MPKNNSLNNFDIDDFLNNYWQKKPCVIRNALPDFINPLSADELAGLACEEAVESRIITEQQQNYSLQLGPFVEQDFQQLPERCWTLLVQAVDHYLPEVASILNYFDFIPRWRIDDIMASYATEGGSVGPHYDNYDVFLIQGLGKRHWQVGSRYNSASPRKDNNHLRLLAEFTSEQEWLLEAGDILYLPPLFGHWGIAADNNCMTYSVGFRAPSHAELLSSFCDEKIQQLAEELRYSDTWLSSKDNNSEISPKALNEVQEILRQQLNDTDFIRQWFGRHMTEQKYAQPPETADEFDLEDIITEDIATEDIAIMINSVNTVYRDPASRFACSKSTKDSTLFVNGCSYSCCGPAAAMAEVLSATDSYPASQIANMLQQHECQAILKILFNQGSLYCDDSIDS